MYKEWTLLKPPNINMSIPNYLGLGLFGHSETNSVIGYWFESSPNPHSAETLVAVESAEFSLRCHFIGCKYILTAYLLTLYILFNLVIFYIQ